MYPTLTPTLTAIPLAWAIVVGGTLVGACAIGIMYRASAIQTHAERVYAGLCVAWGLAGAGAIALAGTMVELAVLLIAVTVLMPFSAKQYTGADENGESPVKWAVLKTGAVAGVWVVACIFIFTVDFPDTALGFIMRMVILLGVLDVLAEAL